MVRTAFRTIATAASLWVTTAILSGCAELMLANSLVSMAAAAVPSNTARLVEINQLLFAYPPEVVYAVVLESVERNGRKIAERNADAQSLRVSYPFSWLKNNWGGMLTITCTASEFGTTVTILGDGRDVVPHVRAIGDEVLDDVDAALRRQPRAL